MRENMQKRGRKSEHLYKKSAYGRRERNEEDFIIK
jgi:hypothetical protein